MLCLNLWLIDTIASQFSQLPIMLTPIVGKWDTGQSHSTRLGWKLAGDAMGSRAEPALADEGAPGFEGIKRSARAGQSDRRRRGSARQPRPAPSSCGAWNVSQPASRSGAPNPRLGRVERQPISSSAGPFARRRRACRSLAARRSPRLRARTSRRAQPRRPFRAPLCCPLRASRRPARQPS
jgi:hypothetical protein